ncbi:hypothetical protein FRB96_006314 [Tulasnella sp. 330]|nr:hypothetical protein FRB96_006314 [Tulasnella sp. 330]KAG8885076.1 hypothetical protein FRB97_002241 [Tulasnella sp. 331]KAG8890635.1 hypothetical protein FRB98_007190 [Tulasnella sp. 332]
MADRPITVAITPDGFADAVKQSADGMAYFTEPCSEKITMPKLLDFLREPPNQHRSVSQNGNLGSGDAEAGAEAGELAPLRGDVPPDVSWATEALDRGPDAVNLWVRHLKTALKLP